LTENAENSHDESMAWFVRLSDEHPEKLVGIALCAIGVGAFGTFVFHQLVLGILGFVMILTSTAEYWLGTHYKLDSKSVSARCGFSLFSMEWPSVKRVVVSGNLIRVSPLENLTRLEPFRGVLLRTLPEQSEHVLKFVRTHCKDNVRILGPGASGIGRGGVDRQSGEGDTPTQAGDPGDFGDRNA
jgi:hypothetical protein